MIIPFTIAIFPHYVLINFTKSKSINKTNNYNYKQNIKEKKMGCVESVPVENHYYLNQSYPGAKNQRVHPVPNKGQHNNKKAQNAKQVNQRIQANKKTSQYQSKHDQLKKQRTVAAQAEIQQRKAVALEKLEQQRAINVPPTTALKRDINKYRRRSATFNPDGKVKTQEEINNFQQQAEELIPAEVRMISGCEDEQTSADVANVGGAGILPNPNGRAGGACTSALLELLYQHKDKKFSFQDALMALRDKLQEQGHSQIPQLTSSRPLDLDATPFNLHNNNNENLHGTRRAVLVGINYVGQQGQLRGCHNDVYRMKEYLINVQGFQEQEIVVLTDDGSCEQPTKQKMIKALTNLVDVSKAGDSVFFHYSGHGGFLEADQNSFKQKNDQYDQTLIPLDHRQAGQIRDFNLFNHFVRPMSKGVNVTCLMDCCHSGSVLDLPFSFKPTNEGKGSAYKQQMNFADMAGIAFLAIMAGVVLDSVLFDPICSSLEDTLGDLALYEGIYADALYEDLIERAIEDEMMEHIIEKQIEEEVNREIEEEITRELERELEEEVTREIEREIEADIAREIEEQLLHEALEDELNQAFEEDLLGFDDW